MTTFSHLALTVDDLPAVRDFYCRVFGFVAAERGYAGRGSRLSQLMEVEDARLDGVFLRSGTFFLELLRYESGHRRRSLPHRDDELGFGHLSFLVGDVEATLAAVAGAGGQARPGTTGTFPFGPGEPTTIAFCTDPEGNRIELIAHPDADAARSHAGFLGNAELGWPPQPEVR